MKVLKELAPYAEIRNCARHIWANFKKVHKGIEYKALYWPIVYATYEADFNLKWNDLKEVNEAAATDFIAKDPKVFCKAFILPISKCDSVDNNMAETFNGWICRARTLHIIDML